MDNDWLMLFAIMFFVLIMTVKVGFLSIINGHNLILIRLYLCMLFPKIPIYRINNESTFHLQAYLLGIVWSCYKYLTSYQRLSGTAIVRTYSADGEDGEVIVL